MRLKRRISLLLALAFIFVFFGGVVWFTNYKSLGPSLSDISIPEIEVGSDGPKVVLHDFERSSTENGVTNWKIRASKGTYIPSSDTALLEEALCFFYDENGQEVQLSAKNAEILFHGSTLANANFSGDVVLFFENGLKLETQQAQYGGDTGMVTVPESIPLVISNDTMVIKGFGLQALVHSEEATVLRKVRTKILSGKDDAS